MSECGNEARAGGRQSLVPASPPVGGIYYNFTKLYTITILNYVCVGLVECR